MEHPGAPSHPIIEETTMTVQPPSVPPIVPRLDEEEPEIEREDDIPSDDNTPVDETSSSRDGCTPAGLIMASILPKALHLRRSRGAPKEHTRGDHARSASPR